MFLVTSSGAPVNSEFSLGVAQGLSRITVESSGGASKETGRPRRNPDYNQLIFLLLERLSNCGAKITRVVLDSVPVQGQPISARTVPMDEVYPITLAHRNIDEFRISLQRRVAEFQRKPGNKTGGNRQKRIQIWVDKLLRPEDFSLFDEVSMTAPDYDTSPFVLETERKSLVSARIGQGPFRDSLLAYFSCCPLTGISHKSLLVASHIKPWAVSTNEERLDPANGIILSALADRLFDKGLITFDDDGNVIFSEELCEQDRVASGLTGEVKLKAPVTRSSYMEYHRTVVFKDAAYVVA